MRLVIDGYNLIGVCPELLMAAGRGSAREALVLALHQYRKHRSHRVTVVFDGELGPDADGERLAGVPVVFAGGGRSADDRIATMAATEGAGLTVVTDDRGLAARCRAHGAEVIPSSQFAPRLMATALGLDPAAPDDELEAWDGTTRKKGPQRRLSKKKRQRQNRLDRL